MGGASRIKDSSEEQIYEFGDRRRFVGNNRDAPQTQ